jgi:hypothetical protein
VRARHRVAVGAEQSGRWRRLCHPWPAPRPDSHTSRKARVVG